jgi:hypothetical protein
VIEEIEQLEGREVRPLVSCGLGMAALHVSKPIRILIGLALLCLLAGVFYVGATLPPSEPPHQAEEQSRTEESVALEDLEKLDSRDGADGALSRIIEDDPERFNGGPCEAWVAEAPSE